MYITRYLNFEVEQINIMAGNQICYVLLKTNFLGFKSNFIFKVIKQKRKLNNKNESVVLTMNLGKNIKGLRENYGITQIDLANKTGISRSYISDLENNRYEPSLETLSKIAIALDGVFIIGDSSNTKTIKENATKNDLNVLEENHDKEIERLKKENELLNNKISRIYSFLKDDLYQVIKR